MRTPALRIYAPDCCELALLCDAYYVQQWANKEKRKLDDGIQHCYPVRLAEVVSETYTA
jgi:hypothetical protein